MYADFLVSEGVMTMDEVKGIVAEYSEWLNGILKSMDTYVPQVTNRHEPVKLISQVDFQQSSYMHPFNE